MSGKSYSVTCDCGATVTVSPVEAGTDKPCACGRSVLVPSLRQLRAGAGETLDRKPELAIPKMVADGELPTGAVCASCGRPTDDVLITRATFFGDQTATGQPMSYRNLAIAFLVGAVLGSFVAMMRMAEGQDRPTRLDLPLRCCPICARDLKRAKLAALGGVPVYRELFAKYPSVQLRVVKV